MAPRTPQSCDRGVRAHAAVAATGFVKKEDEEVLAAFRTCIEEDLDAPPVGVWKPFLSPFFISFDDI